MAVLATAAEARSSYCSASGDYCRSAKRRNGDVLLRIDTFSFSGCYRLCLRAPDRTASCKRFRLRRGRAGIYSSAKGWSRHFPNRGAGVYRVRWQKFGTTWAHASPFAARGLPPAARPRPNPWNRSSARAPSLSRHTRAASRAFPTAILGAWRTWTTEGSI